MNAASQRMAERTYGTPTIARGMAEVDPHRADGIYHIAAKHRVRGEARSYQTLRPQSSKADRSKKVAILQHKIDTGRIGTESMAGLLRDYPELRDTVRSAAGATATTSEGAL